MRAVLWLPRCSDLGFQSHTCCPWLFILNDISSSCQGSQVVTFGSRRVVSLLKGIKLSCSGHTSQHPQWQWKIWDSNLMLTHCSGDTWPPSPLLCLLQLGQAWPWVIQGGGVSGVTVECPCWWMQPWQQTQQLVQVGNQTEVLMEAQPAYK